MKATYGIIGSGEASVKAIQAALNDLGTDNDFIVPYRRNASMESVYDWLIDNEVKFSVVGGNPGRTLSECATNIIPLEKGASIDMGVINELSRSIYPSLLVMWSEDSNKEILEAASAGWKIMELTNGLAPITVEDEEEIDAEVSPVETPAEEVEEPATLTKEELSGMPIAAVKRYAYVQGVDVKGKDKQEIIDTLFPVVEKVEENPLKDHDDAHLGLRAAVAPMDASTPTHRDLLRAAQAFVNTILNSCPAGRERDQAIINVEQASMWAVSSIWKSHNPS